jgi:hypothetical protein
MRRSFALAHNVWSQSGPDADARVPEKRSAGIGELLEKPLGVGDGVMGTPRSI